MATTITYNATNRQIGAIFQATSGGTVFGANVTDLTAFDLFTDTAVLNDAIYFGNIRGGRSDVAKTGHFSDIILDIGTALAGTGITLTWEYYAGGLINTVYETGQWMPTGWTSSSSGHWEPIQDLQDDTAGFTITGVNRVKFPVQFCPYFATINGFTNYLWVRCRISAITTITEGGATQNVTTKCSTGIITVTNSTELAPSNFNEVVQYMNTNYPYITGMKAGHCFFNFSKTPIKISSPLFTTNEVIEIGHAPTDTNLNSYLSYIRSGYKGSDTMGYQGSVFIVNGRANTYPMNQSDTNQKVYGSVIKSRETSNSGYYNFYGESIDNIFECIPQVVTGGTYHNGNRYRFGGCINASTWLTSGIENDAYLVASTFGLIYSPHDFYNWNFKYNDNIFGSFIDNYYTPPSIHKVASETNTAAHNFYGCTNYPRNAIYAKGTGTNAVLSSSAGYGLNSTASDMKYCYFYDASAGTYTDYTAACSPTDANSVPLWGDVDDCIYLTSKYSTALPIQELFLTIPAGQTTNDYEYAFEWYATITGTVGGVDVPANAWYEIGTWSPRAATYPKYATPRKYDRTNNFTKTDRIVLPNIWQTTTNTTINSVSACWIRIRIKTKGTGTPVADGIRGATSSGYKDHDIKFYQPFTYTIKDHNDNPIEGATVIIKDKDGTVVYNKTSNASGVTESAYVLIDWYYYDEVNAVRDPAWTTSQLYWASDRIYETRGKFQIFISKVGYETYYQYKDIEEPVDETIALKKAVPLMIDTKGKVYKKLNQANHGDNRKLITKI